MDYDISDLTAIVRSWGRGVVFRADRWDADEQLELTHLGDTEGDIAVTPNAEVAGLTLPEITGPAMHEADYTGENPVIEIPLFLASPTLLATCSPAGSKHAGQLIRSSVAEHTLVIFPEMLFETTDANDVPTRGTLSYDGAWKLDGVALTAAQLALLDAAFWAWRGFFNRPPRRFLGGPGDNRKQIETVSFQLMQHPSMPEGHQLYTVGNPADVSIELLGSS